MWITKQFNVDNPQNYHSYQHRIMVTNTLYRLTLISYLIEKHIFIKNNVQKRLAKTVFFEYG
jgi:hypothetical protein